MIERERRSGAVLSVGIMTPAAIRARRVALGVRTKDLARAARLSNRNTVHPDNTALTRLDQALRILETGGCIDAARAAIEPDKTGPKPGARSPQPQWPERSGKALQGTCFTDAETHDGGIRRMDTPATVLLSKSSMGC